MEIERKTFELEIKELTDEGTFTGYLSTFGNVDAGHDLVEKGAFKKTLKENKAFPLTWQHSAQIPDLVVGSFSGEEDEKGLKIQGEFFLELEGALKAYRLVKKLFTKGIKIGLSMGYKTLKYVNETLDGIFVRIIKELKLREGALTLYPMNELARVEAIKGETEEDLETKPSKENHLCRVGSGEYIRFRSEKRVHKGKPYTVRYGVRKSDGRAEEYEYFYPKDKWSVSEARSHCKNHDGSFEPAAKNKKDDEFVCASCGRTLSETEPVNLKLQKIAEELKEATQKEKPSGKGEPDLHSHLGKIAEELKTF